MVEKDAREFLSGFDMQELMNKTILNGQKNLLNNRSVYPLLQLMKEMNVDRLNFNSSKVKWSLKLNGDFFNNNSSEKKNGNIKDLNNKGALFTGTNTTMNPYYKKPENYNYSPNDKNTEFVEAKEDNFGFNLERDLQTALRRNINDLEEGLAIIDDGKEKSVQSGRIDITAKDKNGNIVVIELKTGEAPDDSITQILSYMGSLSEHTEENIRGILVAYDFPSKVKYSSKVLPNLKLVKYKFNFKFEEL